MNRENTLTPKEAVAEALIGLSRPMLSRGELPSSLLVTEVRSYIKERLASQLKPNCSQITDKDIVVYIKNGLVLPGDRPPLPLSVFLETRQNEERGRFRIRFEPITQPFISRQLQPEQQPDLKIDASLKILQSFNTIGQPISPEVRQRLARSLEKTGCLEFLQFSCLRIQANLLVSSQPEEYLLTNPANSLFEKGGRDQRLDKLFRSLAEAGVKTTLRVILGDNDEKDYIFPVFGEIPLNNDLCDARKNTYRDNFVNRLRSKYPGWNIVVERMSEIALLYDDVPSCPAFNPTLQKELALDAERMKTAFRVGGFFEGLPVPTSEQAKKIVTLKFQSYAREGFILADFSPDAVLLQNEEPFLFRTQALNLINEAEGKTLLPAVYPYREQI